MERVAQEACAVEYGRLMHRRLALRRLDEDDELLFTRPLLDLMEDHRLDFHATFRRLASFRPALAADEGALHVFVESVLTLCAEPERMDRARATAAWKVWLAKFAGRVESERALWEATGPDVDAQREDAARKANPRFVLRQWVLEEVIKKVEADTESGKRVLRKVLHVSGSALYRRETMARLTITLCLTDGLQSFRAVGRRRLRRRRKHAQSGGTGGKEVLRHGRAEAAWLPMQLF